MAKVCRSKVECVPLRFTDLTTGDLFTFNHSSKNENVYLRINDASGYNAVLLTNNTIYSVSWDRTVIRFDKKETVTLEQQ